MAAAGLMFRLHFVFMAVMVLFPANPFVQGLRPSFITRDVQNVGEPMKSAEMQQLSVVSPRRNLMGQKTSVQEVLVGNQKVNAALQASGLTSEDGGMTTVSARQVPTGPDPLHHNGSPAKPAFPQLP